ncbi:alpha/beta fold hydrolase [Nocardioides dongkuii]|uniref:alpha/beta fold hydrolase n=1 Tax=Nocardioides dongkuii TaxID=2760089 RepID=UPI0015FBF8FF|nr:alpha/beta hydrolase [Nocardioides dongkuii]
MSQNTTPDASTKPTVVLVHGAFVDSSSWNGVLAELRRDGYPVLTAANPLRGLDADVDYLRSILNSVDGPVVLAGHSYGGVVISEAADGNPQVRALVYVAGFILEEGESAGELAAKFPGAQLAGSLRRVPVTAPSGEGPVDDLYIDQEQFRGVFAADVPEEVTDLLAATQRPIVADALEAKATRTAWKTIPSWNLVTLKDLAIPAEAQRFMGERAGSRSVEVDASHAVTVSQPGAVARMIEEAARATTAG